MLRRTGVGLTFRLLLPEGDTEFVNLTSQIGEDLRIACEETGGSANNLPIRIPLINAAAAGQVLDDLSGLIAASRQTLVSLPEVHESRRCQRDEGREAPHHPAVTGFEKALSRLEDGDDACNEAHEGKDDAPVLISETFQTGSRCDSPDSSPVAGQVPRSSCSPRSSRRTRHLGLRASAAGPSSREETRPGRMQVGESDAPCDGSSRRACAHRESWWLRLVCRESQADQHDGALDVLPAQHAVPLLKIEVARFAFVPPHGPGGSHQSWVAGKGEPLSSQPPRLFVLAIRTRCRGVRWGRPLAWGPRGLADGLAHQDRRTQRASVDVPALTKLNSPSRVVEDERVVRRGGWLGQPAGRPRRGG